MSGLLRDVALPFVVTRALLLAVALFAVTSFPYDPRCDVCDLSHQAWLNAVSRWDGGWYLSIARDGYAYVPGEQSNVAFFPLYPLLMRALGGVLGSSDDAYLVAGVVVSNLALLAALVYVAALVRTERDGPTARRAVLYLLVFPTSFFLSVVYADSLFLALAAGTMYHARRGQAVASSALATGAALARPFGVLLVIPLAVELARAHMSRRAWLALAAPLAAFAGWLAYLAAVTGDPLAYLSAQASYGRRPASLVPALGDLFDPRVYPYPWLVIAFTIAIGALVAASWPLLRPGLAAYATALFVVALSSGTLTSAPRYYAVVFPAFAVLAIAARRSAVGRAYVVAASALSALFVAMFSLWYWVA